MTDTGQEPGGPGRIDARPAGLRVVLTALQALAPLPLALSGFEPVGRRLSELVLPYLVSLVVPVVFWRATRQPRTKRWLLVAAPLGIVAAVLLAFVALVVEVLVVLQIAVPSGS